MTTFDEGPRSMSEQVGRLYNEPPEPPREEMWEAIAARIRAEAPSVDLGVRRSRPRAARPAGWLAAAAVAVLALGVGLGRLSAPVEVATPTVGEPAPRSVAGLDFAARDHLGRTESLLTMVRADARSGSIDPAAGLWARGLLSETRLLLDVGQGTEPSIAALLQDLELVLIEIIGAAEAGARNEAGARTELELAIETLEMGEVLPRIHAALPSGIAGT